MSSITYIKLMSPYDDKPKVSQLATTDGMLEVMSAPVKLRDWKVSRR
jgi:hypothetical protein